MIHAEPIDTQKPSESKRLLQSLREDLRRGTVSRTQFLLAAAEVYCTGHLILRAMALLRLIDTETLTPDQSFQYHYVKQKLVSSPPLPYRVCTLNMIVRNEKHTITEALNSIDAIMDEIVICDTGSTDNTVALAEQYGVTIVHDPWQNDFSRARNCAIDASTGDWIFWMDADDRVEESSAEALQNLWRTAPPQGAAFCVINQRDYAAPVPFIQVRLFPRDPDIRFEQCVHEQIMFSMARKKIPFSQHPEIRIHHLGYRDSETHRNKATRNKPLLLAEIVQNPDDPTLQLSLADCFLVLGEPDNACHYYHRIIRNENAWYINADVFVQAHINLAKMYIRNNDLHNAKRFFLRSVYLDKTRIEAYYALGRIFLDEGDEKKAACYFMKSARITPPLRMTAVDNLIIRLESIYYLLELLIAWQRYQEAERILLPAIKNYPMVPQFYNQMGRILFLQSNITKAAFYFTMSTEVSPTNNDDAYKGMADIYTLLGDHKTAAQFLQKTGNQTAAAKK